jgi:hypothetical protein
MDRAALDAAYNYTAAVGLPTRDQLRGGMDGSERCHPQRGGQLDLRYGDGPRQRLDFFPCGGPARRRSPTSNGGYGR